MTAGANLARILQAAARCHATVVLVGDPSQFTSVGPGGALAAALTAHPEIITVTATTSASPIPANAPRSSHRLLHTRTSDRWLPGRCR